MISNQIQNMMMLMMMILSRVADCQKGAVCASKWTSKWSFFFFSVVVFFWKNVINASADKSNQVSMIERAGQQLLLVLVADNLPRSPRSPHSLQRG